ncbi:MAG: EAL domain-containing protein [Halieaceae bacterium]|nr:EAL domain-containing protein [Halieaceae bacterium]
MLGRGGSVRQPFAGPELASGSTGPNRSSDRELSFTLSKNQAIWGADLQDALDSALVDGLQLLNADGASVWVYLPDGSGIVCVAQRSREQGRLEPQGELSAERHPAYFRALALDGFINASDALNDHRTVDLVDSYLRPAGVCALLDVSLRREGRVFGVVCFEQLGQQREWAQQECGLAVDIGNLISQVFLIDELRGQNELLQLLNQLTIGLGSATTSEKFAERAVELIARQFPHLFAGFYRYHSRDERFSLSATSGNDWTRSLAVELAATSIPQLSVCQAVLQRREVVCISDCAEATAFPPVAQSWAQRFGVRTAVGLPLIYGGKVLGCIVLLSADAQHIDDAQLQAFNTLGHTLSVGFANATAMTTMRYRAHHDSLTGLGNKDRLHDDFRALEDRSSALLLLDIKDFKQVNDTFGRSHGDRMLVDLAGRLDGVARQFGGSAYRLSGAEFALLCDTDDPVQSTRSIVPAIHQALSAPVAHGGVTLGFGASIGVAHHPKHGADLDSNLRCADIALSLAKSSRATVQVYDDACNAARPRNLELLTELRKAMSDEQSDQLTMVYQPKLDLTTGELIGCEALLRWNHPVFGFVGPDRFIRVAETGDLMAELTQRVLRMAFRDRQRFIEAGIDATLAVNVSANNIVDEGFPAQVNALVKRFGVPPESLRFEITETALMHDPKRAGRSIASLSEMGIAFEVDDFGTGHSSLAYLRNLPLETLKIDRTFVREMTRQRNDQIIVKSTVGLAHGLGLKVIAEGVEDAETLDMLRELGCDQAQGYHIAKPMDPDLFIEWAHEASGR